MHRMITRLLLLGTTLLCLPASAEEHIVSQKNKEFSVPSIEVGQGDSLTFKNEDSVVHNVFARGGANKFEIKAQLPGQATTIAMDHPGEIDVRCAIHPGMSLKVTVTEKGAAEGAASQ